VCARAFTVDSMPKPVEIDKFVDGDFLHLRRDISQQLVRYDISLHDIHCVSFLW